MANQMVKRLMAICREEGLQVHSTFAVLSLLKLTQGLDGITQCCDKQTAWNILFVQRREGGACEKEKLE